MGAYFKVPHNHCGEDLRFGTEDHAVGFKHYVTSTSYRHVREMAFAVEAIKKLL